MESRKMHIINKVFKKVIINYSKFRNFFKISKLLNSLYYHLYVYKLINKTFLGIHLGGGDLRIDSFINIDANPYCDTDVISGINKLKLNEKSVKYIYNSHILEHIPRAKVYQVITEWYRVLENKGNLYICVPDIEVLFQIYLDNLNDYDQSEKKTLVDLSCGIVYGGQINKYDFHYMGYSMKTLQKILEEIGFKNIMRFEASALPFQKPNDASEAKVDNKNISLNIIATK